MNFSVYPLFLLVLFITIKGQSIEPVVSTKFGTVRGRWMRSADNNIYAGYLGVPYAEPPVGNLRFKDPQEWSGHWKQVHNALEDGPACIQLADDGQIFGKEDCLYLNIFVPTTSNFNNNAKHSVLVYLHGGSFYRGSNNSTYLSPKYLMDRDIIVVTVNYRLGILGFLSTGNEASPGNYGLKDVLHALKWINANIEDFGGDPNSVTLSGFSAGAALAHHLALLNCTEGLFDKLITHSGVAQAPWAVHSPRMARLRYANVAIAVNCTTSEDMVDIAFLTSNNSAELNHELDRDTRIMECLRYSHVVELTETLNLFDEWLESPDCNFGPTIEPEGEGALIVKDPRKIMEDGEFRDIPWIVGTVADEGLMKTADLFVNETIRGMVQDDFRENLAISLEMPEIIADDLGFEDQLMDFYFPDSIDLDEVGVLNNLTKMVGDGIFYFWIYDALSLQSETMKSDIFFYQFTYRGTFSASMRPPYYIIQGIAHGDDVNFIFPYLNAQFADLGLYNTQEDKTMVHIMTEMISSFVKKGVPHADRVPRWQPYQEDFRFMRLGPKMPEISMEEHFLPVRMDFWSSLMGNVSVPREQLFSPSYEEDSVENVFEESSAISVLQYKCFYFQYVFLLCAIRYIFH